MQRNQQDLFTKLVYRVKKDLPPLPTTISELLKIANDLSATSKDVGAVIEKDQAMASKVLRIANSAYYGFTQKIKTISHASVCLGLTTVKNLAFTVSSLQLLNQSLEGYGLKEGELFKHSLTVACGSRIVSKVTKVGNPEEVYIMGLVHDIGKIIMDQYAREELGDVLKIQKEKKLLLYKAETEVLGFNHGKLGGKVAERWNFPKELINAIAYHHAPISASGNEQDVYVVHIANRLSIYVELLLNAAMDEEIFNVHVANDKLLHPVKLQKIGLGPDQLWDIVNQTKSEVIEAFLLYFPPTA
jgi:putative nucleotidyltransferase with HDIG domain